MQSTKQVPDYIVASGSLSSGVPADFHSRIAELGNARGIKIIDAPAENIKLALQRGVYLIKPNLLEFKQLLDDEIKGEVQIKEKAKAMVECGQSEVVVVSLGADGVIVAAEGMLERIISPAVPVVSKVGAGDSMVTGIALRLARDMSVYEAVKFGAAAGSAAVMTPGTELCRRKDAERLYVEMTND